LGFTGLLLLEQPGPINDEQRRQLEYVQLSGRRLLAIIDGFRDAAIPGEPSA